MDFVPQIVRQEEVDALVVRIKALVEKHGGSSDVLVNVRKLYAMFYARPEHACFAFLTSAVEEVERRK